MSLAAVSLAAVSLAAVPLAAVPLAAVSFAAVLLGLRGSSLADHRPQLTVHGLTEPFVQRHFAGPPWSRLVPSGHFGTFLGLGICRERRS